MPAPTTITKILTSNLTDGLASLYAHFNGVSTRWQLDPDVTGDSTNGFVLRQITDTGVGQISMRRSSTTALQVILDPTSSITAAGNTSSGPTGADADESSPEVSFTVSTSTTAEFTVLEWPEEIAVLVKTTTSLYSVAAVVGRALAQDWEDAPGRYVGNSVADSGRAQVWDGGTQAQNWVTVSRLNISGGFISSATLGGLYMPQADIVGVSASRRVAGRMRNWSQQYPAQSPTYRSTNGTAEIVHVAAESTQLVVNWKPGVTP
jgi:hypothetical protein